MELTTPPGRPGESSIRQAGFRTDCELMASPEARAVLYSASERYLGQATRALRRSFPDARLDELAPEVGRLSAPAATVADVAAACRGEDAGLPMPFVRHLAVEDDVVTADELARLPDLATALVAGRGLDRLSLQVWSSGKVTWRAAEVRLEVEAALGSSGREVTRGGQAQMLAVCMTPGRASLGVTSSDDMLADWPGGRVVLGRPPGQVSRAEWKLEELFKLHDVLTATQAGRSPDAPGPRALDLGASPGGWTRILRLRGFDVWAIDPGELHPAVAADPGVQHLRTTAGRFLAATDLSFDLVVNDMRMTAERSAGVMVDAASRLRPGGMAVVTLKVSPQRPMAVVERCLAILGAAYVPVLVRQLYHNRNEVTVLARRP